MSEKGAIAEAVRDEQQRQIEYEVYSAYTPIMYDRRRDSKGGLQDRDNMVATIGKTDDGVLLSIVNRAKGKDEDIYLAPLVEYGDGYEGVHYEYPKYDRDPDKWTYLKSRPFTGATIDSLRRSGLLTEVMKQELNRRGIKTV